MKKKYFNLHRLDNDYGSVAIAPEDHEFDEYFDLHRYKSLYFSFTIVEGMREDYLANDLGWPLMSSKMKEIFQNFSTIGAHWVKSKVLSKVESMSFDYDVLVFKSKIDVLNEKKTSYDDSGLIMIPVYSSTKLKDIDFFPKPDYYSFSIVVSEEIKLKLEMEDITGINFSKAYVE